MEINHRIIYSFVALVPCLFTVKDEDGPIFVRHATSVQDRRWEDSWQWACLSVKSLNYREGCSASKVVDAQAPSVINDNAFTILSSKIE
jgi:hypothetical protein